MMSSLAIFLSVVLGAAQSRATVAVQDAVQTGAQPEEASEPTLDDLDALLGIKPAEGEDGAAEPDEAARERIEKTELERALTGQEVRDQLVQAIQQMQETADRLAALQDTGAATQRLQQEVIMKLEQLIKEVEDQSKSSSSSSQQQQQQGQQNQQSQSQQQQSDQAQGTESQQAQGSERMPPPREREQLRSILDASSAAWGNLPAHYRDGLQQARDQYVSELYQRLTEAYYRKLAEEGSSKP
ncbi:MAG: hypothetical protein KDA20_07205 [Phycisphaerales bacterium]|nr:hypothetical protein [Phycisphaerales bacterium]